jgi:hypothetical protein
MKIGRQVTTNAEARIAAGERERERETLLMRVILL